MSVLALPPKTMIWNSEFAGSWYRVRNSVYRDHDSLAAGDGRVSHLRNNDVVGAVIGSWQWRHHEDVVIDEVHCTGDRGGDVGRGILCRHLSAHGVHCTAVRGGDDESDGRRQAGRGSGCRGRRTRRSRVVRERVGADIIGVRNVDQGPGGRVELRDGAVSRLCDDVISECSWIGRVRIVARSRQRDRDVGLVGRARRADGADRRDEVDRRVIGSVVGQGCDRERPRDRCMIAGVGRRHRDRGCLPRGGRGGVDQEHAVGIIRARATRRLS